MFVLVQDAAETITSADVQLGELVRVGDRFGQRLQWPIVRDALVRPMLVVATRSRSAPRGAITYRAG
jgi:hypothetical protein